MYHQFNMQQFYFLPTQCIYVFCVEQNRIEYIMGSSLKGPSAHRPFTNMPIVPPYSLTFLSAALIKVKICLG